MDLKYSEILRQNATLSRTLSAERYKIAILSNVIVYQAKDILEYALRVENIPAEITIGDYDTIVQDSLKYNTSDLVLIFWELYNLVDGLQFKIESFDEAQIDKLFTKTVAEIDFVFRNLKDSSLVLINTFSALLFSELLVGDTKLERLSWRLNDYLRSTAPENVKVVNVERPIAHAGIAASIDWRYLYSSKAPYTIDFFKTYSRLIKPYVISASGKAKKALIFDCDNTLWKGILGEDGTDGIEMSPATKDGAIFAEIQSIASSLNKQGVLLGLCSKNNAEDVEQIIKWHPDMQLRNEHISIKRVNWENKVVNLQAIARELNIGLDSIVMVDDSEFEANLIREQLPEVTVLEVPRNLYLYPKMLRASLSLFYSLSKSDEDGRKVTMYAEQALRQASKADFVDLESYLSSLGTKLKIYEDDRSIIPRMAQLTQKTNQFNLTTRRYTEADLIGFVEGGGTNVLAFGISDRFGDTGITGLCILRKEPHATVVIDSFLMSCRVLGRNVEFAFMNWLITYLAKRDISRIRAKYIQTQKNAQVRDFFDRCSFPLWDSTESSKDYHLAVKDYKAKPIDYVEIIDGRQN